MEDESRTSVSLSRAELQYLDALIALEEEARSGRREEVVVFEPTEPLGIWVGIGKWAWKHRKKLVALVTAATDLVGLDAKSRAMAERVMADELDASGEAGGDGETTLEELLALREAVTRAQEAQGSAD
ncbi:MAG TPA: hypothetical protein VGE38_06470 [Nocardioides sp.]|uniref:hypothetical protein n=1 Tax=Nocardioides sp. TaxID=35761 RepID=UPI002ED839DC